MPTFEYRGVVHPRRLPLSVNYCPKLRRSNADGGAPDAECSVSIENGRVSITVTVEIYDSRTIDQLFVPALDVARSLVEVQCLLDGVSYRIELEEAVDPDGRTRAIVLADRNLASTTRLFSEIDVERLADAIICDVGISRLINDTTLMLSEPHYSPISSGRIADSIVRLVSGGRQAKHWREMREALAVDELYVRLLTEQSKAHRHGERLYVPGEMTRELAVRAWTLTNRFLVYHLNGRTPLDRNIFPLLVG